MTTNTRTAGIDCICGQQTTATDMLRLLSGPGLVILIILVIALLALTLVLLSGPEPPDSRDDPDRDDPPPRTRSVPTPARSIRAK